MSPSTSRRRLPPLRTLAMAMPFVFVAHVCEEAPFFVAWFNSLVTQGITQQLFLSVNAACLVITVFVAAIVGTDNERLSGLLGVVWIGFLMLANAIFHIIGTVALGRYCPGVITAMLLYLPLSLLFLAAVVRERGVPHLLVGLVALLGGVPMYIHGYLIVFRGTRLF
jgi:hypothetical protein